MHARHLVQSVASAEEGSGSGKVCSLESPKAERGQGHWSAAGVRRHVLQPRGRTPRQRPPRRQSAEQDVSLMWFAPPPRPGERPVEAAAKGEEGTSTGEHGRAGRTPREKGGFR